METQFFYLKISNQGISNQACEKFHFHFSFLMTYQNSVISVHHLCLLCGSDSYMMNFSDKNPFCVMEQNDKHCLIIHVTVYLMEVSMVTTVCVCAHPVNASDGSVPVWLFALLVISILTHVTSGHPD